MPVHPHLADLAVFRLTKDRASRVHLLSRAAAPKHAAELRSEPRSRDVDLSRREVDLGLVEGDVLPVDADRGDAAVGLAERRLEEHGVVTEHRRDGLDVAALPALAEGIDQRAKDFAHGRNIVQSGYHAANVTLVHSPPR